jgi:hypothetical protein
MKSLEAVDLYEYGDRLILELLGRQQNDMWVLAPEFDVLSSDLPDEDLGAALREALARSGRLRLHVDDPRAHHERVLQARDALAGLDRATFTRSVRQVSLNRMDPADVNVTHTDGFGGDQPGYRQYRDYVTLSEPTDDELGCEVRAAFARSTYTVDP